MSFEDEVRMRFGDFPGQPGSSRAFDRQAFNSLDEQTFTLQERWDMLRYHQVMHGYGNLDLIAFGQFWADFDPAVLKRYWRYLDAIGVDRGIVFNDDEPASASAILMHISTYTALGYAPGVEYQLITSKLLGIAKSDVLAAMEFGFIEAGPMGMHHPAQAAQRSLWDWTDPPKPYQWPDGWGPDPSAFSCGLDYSNHLLSPAEIEGIESWYTRVFGEVPRWVRYLVKNSPAVFKAYRNRFEKTFSGTLPKQMAPICLLHLAVVRDRPPAIRSAAKMALAFGLPPEQVLATACFGLLHAGHTGIESILTTIEDVLES